MPKPTAQKVSLPGPTPARSASSAAQDPQPAIAKTPQTGPPPAAPQIQSALQIQSAPQVPVSPPAGPQFSGAPQIAMPKPEPVPVVPVPAPASASYAPQFAVISNAPHPIAVTAPALVAAPTGAADLPPWLRQPEPAAPQPAPASVAPAPVAAETLGLPSDWRNLLV
jgi:hypothetical protein